MEWQIQVPVGTCISAQQGRISISKTKRNHIGQGLEYTGGEAKQLLFLFLKTPKLLRRYERGHCHVEDGYA
jgi:hypothetical protein